MLNCINIVGRLVADAELRKTAKGTSVASFRIANDQGKDANGEKSTVFIQVSVFGNQSDFAVKYFRKGDLIAVTGRITQRKYTNKNGVEVTSTEIIADRLDFVESKSAKEENGDHAPEGFEGSKTNEPNTDKAPQGQNLEEIDVVDDDIPF